MLCRKYAILVILNEAKRSEESLWLEKLEILPLRLRSGLKAICAQNDEHKVFYKSILRNKNGKMSS